jgi:hypothetical protein
MATSIYQERMDRIFSDGGSTWEHRTLRTIFDPLSDEWNDTSFDEKKDILSKIILSGEKLEILIHQYQSYYSDQGRKDIVRELPIGLAEILTHVLA